MLIGLSRYIHSDISPMCFRIGENTRQISGVISLCWDLGRVVVESVSFEISIYRGPVFKGVVF